MYSCEVCKKTFQHERNLKRHRLTHQPEKNPLRSCPHCPATFNRADNLKNHIKNTHSSKKSFTCALCPKSFSELKNLKRHISQSHQQTNRLKCPHCKAEYSRAGNLDRHLKAKHATPVVSAEATASRSKQTRKARLRVDQFPDDEPEDFLENKEEEEELKKIQKEHWSSIKTHSRKGKVQTFVNVRWEN